MNKAAQETTTEVKTLSITDENISQGDYERLRGGETIEVESAPEEKEASGETVDESETSNLEAKDSDGDEESDLEEGDDEASEHVKPKKKSGTQRRIEKLVKQRSEVERERDYLRAQLAQSQGKPEAQKVSAKVESLDAPKSEDFDSYDEYVSARIKHEAKELRKAEKAEEEKAKIVGERKQRVETHNQRVDAYRKDNPEFDKNLAAFFEEQGTDFNLSMALEELLTESENGPQLLHELTKTPDEFERINSLGAMGIAREIGRLEAKLSNTSQTKKTESVKTKTTKAPPPARPLSASSANGKKSPEDMTQSEYERYRDELDKRRRA
jgi:hypothetical protein